MVPKSALVSVDPTMMEQLTKNITRQGMSNATLNYLRVRILRNANAVLI